MKYKRRTKHYNSELIPGKVKVITLSNNDFCMSRINLVAEYLFTDGLIDSSGNGYDLYNYGGTFITDPLKGTVLNISEVDDFTHIVSAALTDIFTGQKTYTVAFWMKHSSIQLAELFKASDWTQGASTVSIFLWSDGKIKFRREIHNPYPSRIRNDLETPQVLSFGWNHIACSYDGSTMKIYINGSLSAAKNSSLSTTANGYMWFGNGTENVALPGQYKNLKIFNRALSQYEVISIINGNIKYYDSNLK